MGFVYRICLLIYRVYGNGHSEDARGTGQWYQKSIIGVPRGQVSDTKLNIAWPCNIFSKKRKERVFPSECYSEYTITWGRMHQ